MKNFGFTLSEVLITLAVIGVVSAMTLPTVIQKQRDKANVSKLQKTYSVLSQALLRAKEDQGDFANWPAENTVGTCTTIFSYIKPYIKTLKICGNGIGCWALKTKSLSGKDAEWFTKTGGGISSTYSFILYDGTFIIVDVVPIVAKSLGLNENETNGLAFWVDVNGIKGPNTFGRDIFAFAISHKGLVPFGYADNSANCNPDKNSVNSGYGCTFKVLQEKAINY